MPRSAPDAAAPRPAGPLYVIGDVHGRADLLDTLLARIAADIDAQAAAPARTTPGGAAGGDTTPEGAAPEAAIVLVGDYVDRGPDARGVLELLAEAVRQAPGEMICLMGNHERMMLDFLDRPETCGPRWLRGGGARTLASFGIGGMPDPEARLHEVTPEHYAGAAARLRAAMPPGMEAWLRALPLWHASGDVVCVHAAMDPDLPPEAQSERDMLWDCRRFRARPRRDGLWVVHGHSVVHAPAVSGRRVAVDTGAWFSDRLSAAALRPGAPVRFVQAVG